MSNYLRLDALYPKLSYPDFITYTSSQELFEAAAAYMPASVRLRIDDVAWRGNAQLVSPGYFSALGVRSRIGRLDVAADINGQSVVVSEALWRRQFGADPEIVGRKLEIDGRTFVIADVAWGFVGLDAAGASPDVWMPVSAWRVLFPDLEYNLTDDRFSWGSFRVVARLRKGVSAEKAEAATRVIASQLEREWPSDRKFFSVAIQPVRGMLYPGARDAGLALGAKAAIAAAVVLLVACLNAACVLRQRMSEQRKVLAVRLALGASHTRLGVSLLAELMVVLFASGVLAVMVAAGSGHAMDRLLRIAPAAPETDNVLSIVAGVGLAGVAATALLAMAGISALRTIGGSEVLSESVRHVSRRELQVLRVAIIAQLSLAMTLMACAFVVERAVRSAVLRHLGFTARSEVLSVRVELPKSREPNRIREILDALQAETASLPAVRSVAIASRIPLDGEAEGNSATANSGDHLPNVPVVMVSGHYFTTMGIPLLRGHDLDRAPTPGERQAVVSAAAARRLWPTADPIGKTFWMGANPDARFEVVGVSGNAAIEPTGVLDVPVIYTGFPAGAKIDAPVALLVRSDSGSPDRRNVIARAQSIDSSMLVFSPRSMQELRDAMTAHERQTGRLLSLMSILATTLGVLGAFGVVAYSLTQRARELAIRTAVGATALDISRLVAADVGRVFGLAIVLGVPGAFIAARSLVALSVPMNWLDQLIGVGAAGTVLAAAALVATGIWSLKASRMHALTHLRS